MAIFEALCKRNCNREEIRKKLKILEKNNIEALVISIERTTQVVLVNDRTAVIIIWRRKELSNLDSLKGFSMHLRGNCLWVPLSTIA